MPWLSKTIFDMGFDELILSCWKWKKDIKSNILNLEKQIMSLDTIKINYFSLQWKKLAQNFFGWNLKVLQCIIIWIRWTRINITTKVTITKVLKCKWKCIIFWYIYEPNCLQYKYTKNVCSQLQLYRVISVPSCV